MPIAAPALDDGGLLVVDGRIGAVGPFNELRGACPSVEVVDFGDAVLLPPMVNAHCHLELSDFALWAETAGKTVVPTDFVDWLLWLVSIKRALSPHQLAASLRRGLQTSLAAGSGAVGDIITNLGSVPAYATAPLRGRVYAEVLGQDPAAVDERLEAISQQLAAPPAADMSWGLSPHAPYTLSASALETVFDFAARRGLSCAMHLAESRAESRFVHAGDGPLADRLYAVAGWDPAADRVEGVSPLAALCRPGRLRAQDLVIHGVEVDGADIDRLKRRGSAVVLCPRSNAALGSGHAPVAEYLAAGVPLALGTDSLACVSTLSLWDELAFAQSWFGGAVPPSDWLAMATRGGAEALGLAGRMGELRDEFEASFQVIELPQLPSAIELEEALCHAGPAITVKHLFLAGVDALRRAA
jgi:cytosine/adenosine deaminase-related metal-dependent hydrolase